MQTLNGSIMMWVNLVLTDGNVLTMNPSQSHAEAVAIRKDRIVKVGANSEVSRWIGKNTKIISFPNRKKPIFKNKLFIRLFVLWYNFIRPHQTLKRPPTTPIT